jgi:DNA-binding CsgD family transcriptional regulator
MVVERNISREMREYVRFIAQESAADGIDIFCCDKTDGHGEIFDLYVHGMRPELKEGYRCARMFEFDPFTDVGLRESSTSEIDSFELAGDPRLDLAAGRTEPYWRFMAQQGVEIVGASTRRILPGFYLVIGMSRGTPSGARPELSYGLLNERLDRLKDMMSSLILTRILSTGEGYAQLRRSLSWSAPSSGGSLAALSVRESEIAKLICSGKQNKEIAYLTGLSVHTIENHLKRIYRKFEIHNRAALVAKMQGLIH